MRNKRWNFFIIGFFTVIALFSKGCGEDNTSPTEPFNTLALYVDVDKSVYSIGEFVTVYVKATTDCYLVLYDIDTQGEVSQVFPNQYASDNLLEGGVVYQIPTETDEFDYQVVGPPGTEQVHGVCVTPDSSQQAEDTATFQVVW